MIHLHEVELILFQARLQNKLYAIIFIGYHLRSVTKF